MEQVVRVEDFGAASTLRWQTVNDGVMGGISNGKFQLTEVGHGLFSGEVSLENNGGFASVRASLQQGLPKGLKKVRLRIKGGGKRYSFRIRMDHNFDGVSYRYHFRTQPGEWQVLTFPLKDFAPSFRGRILSGQAPIQSEKIEQIGFLIANEQAGPFNLEIDWIEFL